MIFDVFFLFILVVFLFASLLLSLVSYYFNILCILWVVCGLGWRG